MLRNFNELYGITVAANDGSIGEIRDCYFSDDSWKIRFLVVETGEWLGGRKVLISPIAVQALDWANKVLSTSLSRKQVSQSPDVDTAMPVSRQHEVEHFGYYGYPIYWGEPELWGGGPRPGISLTGYPTVEIPHLPVDTAKLVEAQVNSHRARGDDMHLRSCRAIERYHLHATDGDIGHVDSLMVDDDAWDVRYLVVNTSDWWFGHQILIAPAWITEIDWLDAAVAVDLTRHAVKGAPTFDTHALPNQNEARRLAENYRTPKH
jgi:hypothetical protein